jgi:GGDEF domain-containing protein
MCWTGNLPLVDDNSLTMGVAVAFEEAPTTSILEMPGALMCGCLDPRTGVSSQRLTRTVLTESLAELQDTHGGWGFLRIRTLGLKELSARYGTDSIAAFLRTSAQTIRHSLRAEDFLGRWGEDEFLVRIELLESDKGTFFDIGSPHLKPSGQEILALLAVQLGQVPNHLSIEGHTDAKPYSGKGSYSNWELSADRANAARRLMDSPGFGSIKLRRYGALPIEDCAIRKNRRRRSTGACRSLCSIWPATARWKPRKRRRMNTQPSISRRL